MAQLAPSESVRAWLRALPSSVLIRHLLGLRSFGSRCEGAIAALDLLRSELRRRETAPAPARQFPSPSPAYLTPKIEHLMRSCREQRTRNASIRDRSEQAILRLQAAALHAEAALATLGP
jgi:hypothetical protein